MTQPRPGCDKLLIIGLDGVSLEMIRGAGGRLLFPGLQARLENGFMTPMAAALPAISPVSWAGFMTGRDSGDHGIYGFVDLEPGSLKIRFPNFSDLARPTFFDELGRGGKRSVVINLPGTYPARPFPGVLVSGFVAPELERSVYPAALLPLLRDLGYRTEPDNDKGRNRKQEFLAELSTVLQARLQLAEILWQREQWDIFTLVFTETDRLNHFFYDAFEEEDHPLRADFLASYRAVDRAACRMLDLAAGKPGLEVMILSDHGFCRKQREVYLQPILEKHGYFASRDRESRHLETMLPHSRAFALDPARIFINNLERFPGGPVRSADLPALRRELAQFFTDLRIEGRKVVEKVYTAGEIYHGPLLSRAADLLLIPAPGQELRAGSSARLESSPSPLPGMHSQGNAFFYSSRPPETAAVNSIHDLRAFIFNLFGLPAPDSLLQ